MGILMLTIILTLWVSIDFCAVCVGDQPNSQAVNTSWFAN